MRLLLPGLLLAAFASAATAAPEVTFYKDVLPVLQDHCQGCHRPGEAAPMSLLTYDSTRPWAKAMKANVLTGKMPPWFADPHYGHFSNDRRLSKVDIDTLVAWADTGAQAGDPKDAPAPKQFVEGWRIPKPDVVFQMPSAFDVPASGTIDYQYVVIPTGFTDDKWVQMAEARPGSPKLVHHIIAFIREPGSKWLSEAKPGVPFVPREVAREENKSGKKDKKDDGFTGDFLAGYAPGTVPNIMKPGEAKLIKAGSDIVLQLHYTANGTAGSDRSRVGIVFAASKPEQRVVTLASANEKFAIPPGDANYEVDSTMTLYRDATLISMLPHMHFRGKSFEYRAIYPDGRKETLLVVPHYNFNWQLSYDLAKPKLLPKGTVIECTAHYDNSVNNPFNPDPTKEVKYGEQTWEEMMFGFFDVAVPPDTTVMDLVAPPKTETARR